MKRLKAFKFQLYPTREQAKLINRACGCKRLVYNAMLELRQSVYKQTGKSLSRFDCNKLLPGMKAERPFLKEVDSTALQAANDDLDAAYKAFFAKKGGYPTFHKKGRSDSYTTTSASLKVDGCRVSLPKLGWVKFAICGQRYEKLGGREHWTCPHCGAIHDRNINVAINIKRKGLEFLIPAA